MRISRKSTKPVKASEFVDYVEPVEDNSATVTDTVVDDVNTEALQPELPPVPAEDLSLKCNKYECAIEHVVEAIKCLSDCAMNGDDLAKEGIANLSVVLLELK